MDKETGKERGKEMKSQKLKIDIKINHTTKAIRQIRRMTEAMKRLTEATEKYNDTLLEQKEIFNETITEKKK